MNYELLSITAKTESEIVLASSSQKLSNFTFADVVRVDLDCLDSFFPAQFGVSLVNSRLG